MIEAKIIADSIAPSKVRLTTFVLTYPRFIHAEFMTHRMISRNASSSRAIPTAKFIESIRNEPAMPNSFTKNCKGMQAKEQLDCQDDARRIWLEARDSMLDFVQKLSDLGVHKQHANRLLEPFQHITVVATATDWSNFFALRTHPDAQPEFQDLANKMWNVYSSSNPNLTGHGKWHLPFITSKDTTDLLNDPGFETSDQMIDRLIKVSVARCARVSYNTHDGTSGGFSKDEELYNRLVGNSPIHASPTEHQAMAISDESVRSGNFRGWIQYRKTLTNENVINFSGNN